MFDDCFAQDAVAFGAFRDAVLFVSEQQGCFLFVVIACGIGDDILDDAGYQVLAKLCAAGDHLFDVLEFLYISLA